MLRQKHCRRRNCRVAQTDRLPDESILWKHFNQSKWSNFISLKWSNFNQWKWSNLQCRVVLVKYWSKLLKISFFSIPPKWLNFGWSKWSDLLTYFEFAYVSKKFFAFKKLKISRPKCNWFYM